MPPYEGYQTEISRRYLDEVVEAAEEPFCVLGGWAVHFLVSERFRKAQGRDYAFSRDIDLGFHLQEDMTAEELRTSSFGRTLQALKAQGFQGLSARLYKQVHTETRKELGPDAARKTPRHFLFDLYVDMLVDVQPAACRDAFRFTPLDEPRLARVFRDGLAGPVEGFGGRLLCPEPAVLLEMKLAAIMGRPPEKDEKRAKDLSDIFALLAYGGKGPGELYGAVRDSDLRGKARAFLADVPAADVEAASAVAGVRPGHLRDVVLQVVRT